jgi:CRP-like cAMP-binding protein
MLDKLLEKFGITWPEEAGALLSTEQAAFKKGSIITAQGSVENYIYFLEKGSVKFSHWVDVKEFILDFWFEGDFFTSFVSFIERTPSPTQCQALTDVVVQRIHYQQLQDVYRNSHVGSEIGRRMAERMYVHKTKKEIELLSLTAEQRYAKLLEQSKRLILEIPVKDVASYLGILPESLSRTRRKLIS